MRPFSARARTRRAPSPTQVKVEVIPIPEPDGGAARTAYREDALRSASGGDAPRTVSRDNALRTAYRLLARKIWAEQGEGECGSRFTSE